MERKFIHLNLNKIIQIFKRNKLLMIRNILHIIIGLMISSCYSNIKNQKERQQLQIKDSNLIACHKKGVDFIANGNNPEEWQLKMDVDKSFDFTSANKFNISCTPVNPIVMNDGTEIYNAKSGNTIVRIAISEQKTNSNPSQNNHKKNVAIFCNDKIYKGSGEFTFPSDLHAIWLLEKIGATNYTKKNKLRHYPSLQFNLFENNVTVHDEFACFIGNIDIKGNYIKFTTFSKRKKDGKTNEISEIFTTQIENHLLEYFIVEDRLIILLNDDKRMTFRKRK